MKLTKDFQLRDLKADDAGTFTGRASVYGIVDSYGDVVMPGAFAKTLQESGGRIVVLNQHNPADPIGMARLIDRHDGLHAEGQLELDIQSAREAHIRAKKGLVTGISIGFETLKEDFKNGVRQLKEIKLWEISLVTFPANSAARVTGVKQVNDEWAALMRDVRAFRHELQQKGDAEEAQTISDILAVLRRRLDGDGSISDEEFNRLLARLNTLIGEAEAQVAAQKAHDIVHRHDLAQSLQNYYDAKRKGEI